MTPTIDSNFASLEAALAKTPVGGVLEVRTAHSRTGAFTIDKSVTVRFLEAGAITVESSSIAAIDVAAKDVRIEDAMLFGTGGETAGDGDGIRAVACSESPLVGIQIIRPRISEFAKHGILLEHVHGFQVVDVEISRCGYAGIMLLSAINGSVTRGTIKNILQPSGYVNSYGVAVSRRSDASIMSAAPRSRDVTVEGLTIDGVPEWEALDTHAGENITFRGNAVYNARTGVAIVGSKGESGTQTTYAPMNCRVVDNTFSFGGTSGTADRGIVFAGAADDPGVPLELATGLISGNVIRDYGAQDWPGGTSIQLYGTAGVSVTDNTIINSGSSGIDFFHDNYGAKAMGNTIIDVWTNGTACAAVQLRSSHNKISISDTTIVRMSKVAAKVNDCGLNIADLPTNVVLDSGGNDWAAAATVATVGDATTSEARSFAKRTGFYGAKPVTQASAIPSPTTEPAALKSAIDSIRSTLSRVGLTR